MFILSLCSSPKAERLPVAEVHELLGCRGLMPIERSGEDLRPSSTFVVDYYDAGEMEFTKPYFILCEMSGSTGKVLDSGDATAMRTIDAGRIVSFIGTGKKLRGYEYVCCIVSRDEAALQEYCRLVQRWNS